MKLKGNDGTVSVVRWVRGVARVVVARRMTDVKANGKRIMMMIESSKRELIFWDLWIQVSALGNQEC